VATTCTENGRSEVLKLVRFKDTERSNGTQYIDGYPEQVLEESRRWTVS
jgi:hypothetical protein